MLVFYFIYINKKYLETTLYKFWSTYNVISKITKQNKISQALELCRPLYSIEMP